MKFKVYNSDASSSSEKEFSSFPVLEEGKGVQALREMLIAMDANRRQGNASTKTRGEVRGGGKKPWRQKGTGNARAGSRRSPIWRGGGIVFGPRPRDYSKQVNRKVKRLALQRALNDLANAGKIFVIESLNSPETPKTKAFSEVLGRVASEGKLLLVDDVLEDNVVLSARNIARVGLSEAGEVNVRDLSHAQSVLFTEAAFEKIIERASVKEAAHAAA